MNSKSNFQYPDLNSFFFLRNFSQFDTVSRLKKTELNTKCKCWLIAGRTWEFADWFCGLLNFIKL